MRRTRPSDHRARDHSPVGASHFQQPVAHAIALFDGEREPVHSWGGSGKRRRNVVPRPGWLSAAIEPR